MVGRVLDCGTKSDLPFCLKCQGMSDAFLLIFQKINYFERYLYFDSEYRTSVFMIDEFFLKRCIFRKILYIKSGDCYFSSRHRNYR